VAPAQAGSTISHFFAPALFNSSKATPQAGLSRNIQWVYLLEIYSHICIHKGMVAESTSSCSSVLRPGDLKNDGDGSSGSAYNERDGEGGDSINAEGVKGGSKWN
jgi:hypothetical protein